MVGDSFSKIRILKLKAIRQGPSFPLAATPDIGKPSSVTRLAPRRSLPWQPGTMRPLELGWGRSNHVPNSPFGNLNSAPTCTLVQTGGVEEFSPTHVFTHSGPRPLLD